MDRTTALRLARKLSHFTPDRASEGECINASAKLAELMKTHNIKQSELKNDMGLSLYRTPVTDTWSYLAASAIGEVYGVHAVIDSGAVTFYGDKSQVVFAGIEFSKVWKSLKRKGKSYRVGFGAGIGCQVPKKKGLVSAKSRDIRKIIHEHFSIEAKELHEDDYATVTSKKAYERGMESGARYYRKRFDNTG